MSALRHGSLEPCAFCGGPARLDRKTGVTGVAVKTRWLREQAQCKNKKCGVSGPVFKRAGQAVTAWNNRLATLSPGVSPEQVAEAQDAAVGGLLERLPQSLAVIKGLALRRLEGAKHDASRKWRSRRGDQASYMVEAREHATVGSVPLNALLDVIEAASLAMQGGSDG